MQNHVEPNNKKHLLCNNKHIVFESLGITAITLGVAFLIDEALGKPQDSLADYVIVREENTTQSHQPSQPPANPVNNHVTQKDHVSEQQNTNPSLLVDANNHIDTNNLSLKKIQKDLDDLNKEVEQIMRSEKQTDQRDYSITRNDEPAMGKTPPDMIKLPGYNAPANPNEDAQIDLTEQNFSHARSEKDGSHKGASNEEDTASDSSFFNSPLGYLTGAGIAGVGAVLGTSLSGDTPPGGSTLQTMNTNLAKTGTPTEKNTETTEKNNPQVPQIQTFKSIIENRADTPAPDFTLTDVLGDEYSLYESFLNQGKIVVMDFYATWCPHCQTLRDSGLLSSLAEEYGDKIVVITIEAASNSTHDDLIEFFGGSLEGHSELIFEETSLNSTFGLQYFPTLFAISTTGEMLDFGSVKTEFADHHQLYEELVAYEHAYGTVEETKEDNVAEDVGDDIVSDKVDSDHANQYIQSEPHKMDIFDSLLANSYIQPAPDFTLTDVFGDEYSLFESFLDEGKVAVIDFYATWCPHCQSLRDTGLLSSLAEEYADDVVVITIEAASNSNHDDLIEFFGGSLEGHSELIFEETSLNTTFGLQYFPTLLAVSSTGEMLNFGSARAEFSDHHALYQELMAFEDTYGNLEGDKPDNENAVACDTDTESTGCGIPTTTGDWEQYPVGCGNGVIYEGSKTVTDFTLTDIDGHTHALSETLAAGKYVIVNFFSAGCSHCLEGYQDDTALTQILENHDDVVVFHIEMNAATPLEQLALGYDGFDWTTKHDGVDTIVFNLTTEEIASMSTYTGIEELEICGWPGAYIINNDFSMIGIDRYSVTGDELYQTVVEHVGLLTEKKDNNETLDTDVILHLNNLTDTSIDIVYEAQVPIQAYQFSLTLDGQIDSITTGAFDIIQFNQQQPGNGEHIAIGLSTAGTTLPAGSGTLATINFTTDANLVLNDFILANEIIISNGAEVSSDIAQLDNNDANLAAEETSDEAEVVKVEEQPVDDETPVILNKTKNLLWTEYDESTQDLSVYVNLVEQACGYQMDVPGYEILDTGIGFSEDAGYMHSFRDSKVLSYSMSADAIEPGEGVLTTLNIQPNAGHNSAPQLMDIMLAGCDNSFSILDVENIPAPEAAPQAVVDEAVPPVEEDVVIEEEVLPVKIAPEASVVLSLNNLTSQGIDIIYESQVPIQAYQFSLTLDGQIDSITTGAFDIIQFKEQQPGNGEHIAIGLSTAGTTLPAGSGTLATISFTTDANLVLNDFILADEIIISNGAEVSSGIGQLDDNDVNIVAEETTDETEAAKVVEQPVDDETPVILDKTKNLLWTEYDESTQDLSVYVNLVEQACGYQMDVPGYEILDTGIGFSEDAGYMHSFRDSKVLSYSMSADAIEPGEGVLTTLNIQPNAGHDSAPQLMDIMLVGCDNSFSILDVENIPAPEAAPQAVVDEAMPPVEEDVVIEEEVLPVKIAPEASVVLSLNNLTNQGIDIIYESQVPIQAYQFSLTLDGQIDSITTGAFDIIQFKEQQPGTGEHIAIGLSTAGTTLPAGSGTLATISFTTDANLVLNDFILADEIIISNGAEVSSGIVQLDDNDANLAAKETTDETEAAKTAEQPVDDETPDILDKTKNLLWTEYDESTQDLSVYVNIVEQACGFQMDIPGYEILDTGAGFAKDAGYMHTFRDGKVLGYSMSADAIDPDEGVLTTLNIQPNAGHDAVPQLMDVMLVGCDDSFAALPIENLSAEAAAPQAVVEEEVQPVAEDVVIDEEVQPDAEVVAEETTDETEAAKAAEQPVDDETPVILDKTKNLLWTEYDENTQDLSVYVNIVEQACGFQMDIPGYEILDTGAGFAEDAGYMHTFRDGKVLGYSMSADAIEPDEGVLTTLNIQPNAGHDAVPQLMDVMLVGCDDSFAALPIENLSAEAAAPQAVVEEEVQPVAEDVVIDEEVQPDAEVVAEETTDETEAAKAAEQPVDDETPVILDKTKNLLWTEYDENTQDLSVYVNIVEQACGFQMDIPGYEILDTGAGFAEDAGYMHTFRDGKVLGYSMSADAIEPDEGVLTTLNIQPNAGHDAVPQLMDVMLVGCDDSFAALPIENLSAEAAAPQAVVEEEVQPVAEDVIIEEEVLPVEIATDDPNDRGSTIDDVVLSLDNLTSSRIEVMYETQQPIQAYAFKLSFDGQINNAITSEFDNIQILETAPGSSESYVLGFSNTGATLPLGSHTLASIEFTANSDLQLSDFVLSNETLFANTVRLNSTIIESNDDQEPTIVTPAVNTVDTTAHSDNVAADVPYELNYFKSLVDAGTQSAPDFKLTDIDGNEVDLYADYLDQGTPVILELFATWCGYCKSFAQSNLLADLATDYAEEVQVIMIEASGSSTRADLDAFLANPDYNLQDEIIIESTEINSAYGLQYFPTLFAINTEGEMINWGSVRNSLSTAEDLFEEILAFEAATTVKTAPTTVNAIEINVTINQPSADDYPGTSFGWHIGDEMFNFEVFDEQGNITTLYDLIEEQGNPQTVFLNTFSAGCDYSKSFANEVAEIYKLAAELPEGCTPDTAVRHNDIGQVAIMLDDTNKQTPDANDLAVWKDDQISFDVDMPLYGLTSNLEVFSPLYSNASSYVDLNTASPFYSILSKQENADGSLGYVLAAEPYPAIQPGQAMIDLIENFVAPEDMSPVADHLSSLCEQGQACFIMLGDMFTTASSSISEVTITDELGQTLLSSDNIEWTPNETINGTHMILTLDEIPTSVTTFNFNLTDSGGNGWSDANSEPGEIAGGIWLHHPNGDTELLHLFNEGFEKNLEITLHPEDDDSIF